MRIKQINGAVTAVAVVLAALLHCAPLQARQMLAPDAQGYQFIDSAERLGPQYAFADISKTGTRLNLQDDGSVEVRLGFGFGFYGKTYYTAFVSANGYISFVPGDGNYNGDGRAIPQPATTPGWQTPPFIAPWFDDLDPEAGGNVYFEVLGEGPNRRAVVQWSVPHHDDHTAMFEFEAQLYQSSNRILFQYRKTGANNPALSHGASATVGIQGSDAIGIGYSANQALLTDELAIGFVPVKYDYIGLPSGPQQQSGGYGQVLSYQVEVVNGRDVATDFTVEQLPGSRWQVVAPTSTGLIESGQSKTVTVTVTVPVAGAAAIGDDIVTLKVANKVVETTVDTGGTGSTTNTQNNEETTSTTTTTTKELRSIINLKTLCQPAPCFQQDSDGDGVPDELEAASSRNNASKVDGFAVLSGALVNVEVDKEVADGKGTLYGFRADEATGGPENKVFAEGVLSYRILPRRIAENVTITITPPVAWPEKVVLYSVDSKGKYTAVDEKKWKLEDDARTSFPSITLTLVDGADFDEDGVANGVIVSRLALGVDAPPKDTGAGFGSGGALFGELLLLLALGGWRYASGRNKQRTL